MTDIEKRARLLLKEVKQMAYDEYQKPTYVKYVDRIIDDTCGISMLCSKVISSDRPLAVIISTVRGPHGTTFLRFMDSKFIDIRSEMIQLLAEGTHLQSHIHVSMKAARSYQYLTTLYEDTLRELARRIGEGPINKKKYKEQFKNLKSLTNSYLCLDDEELDESSEISDINFRGTNYYNLGTAIHDAMFNQLVTPSIDDLDKIDGNSPSMFGNIKDLNQIDSLVNEITERILLKLSAEEPDSKEPSEFEKEIADKLDHIITSDDDTTEEFVEAKPVTDFKTQNISDEEEKPAPADKYLDPEDAPSSDDNSSSNNTQSSGTNKKKVAKSNILDRDYSIAPVPELINEFNHLNDIGKGTKHPDRAMQAVNIINAHNYLKAGTMSTEETPDITGDSDEEPPVIENISKSKILSYESLKQSRETFINNAIEDSFKFADNLCFRMDFFDDAGHCDESDNGIEKISQTIITSLEAINPEFGIVGCSTWVVPYFKDTLMKTKYEVFISLRISNEDSTIETVATTILNDNLIDFASFFKCNSTDIHFSIKVIVCDTNLATDASSIINSNEYSIYFDGEDLLQRCILTLSKFFTLYNASIDIKYTCSNPGEYQLYLTAFDEYSFELLGEEESDSDFKGAITKILEDMNTIGGVEQGEVTFKYIVVNDTTFDTILPVEIEKLQALFNVDELYKDVNDYLDYVGSPKNNDGEFRHITMMSNFNISYNDNYQTIIVYIENNVIFSNNKIDENIIKQVNFIISNLHSRLYQTMLLLIDPRLLEITSTFVDNVIKEIPEEIKTGENNVDAITSEPEKETFDEGDSTDEESTNNEICETSYVFGQDIDSLTTDLSRMLKVAIDTIFTSQSEDKLMDMPLIFIMDANKVIGASDINRYFKIMIFMRLSGNYFLVEEKVNDILNIQKSLLSKALSTSEENIEYCVSYINTNASLVDEYHILDQNMKFYYYNNCHISALQRALLSLYDLTDRFLSVSVRINYLYRGQGNWTFYIMPPVEDRSICDQYDDEQFSKYMTELFSNKDLRKSVDILLDRVAASDNYLTNFDVVYLDNGNDYDSYIEKTGKIISSIIENINYSDVNDYIEKIKTDSDRNVAAGESIETSWNATGIIVEYLLSTLFNQTSEMNNIEELHAIVDNNISAIKNLLLPVTRPDMITFSVYDSKAIITE